MCGWLVLFDIDGTLIDTRGAGLAAIERAVRDLYGDGDRLPELDLGGATDAGLVREVLAAYGVEPGSSAIADFYEAYLVRLAETLQDAEFAGVLLPGVRELLEVFRESGAILGLLTGNLEDGARLKLRRFGLDDYFAFGAFGHERVERTDLGPIALARAQQLYGRPFCAAETVIIGDTPRDVSCGRALGARTIAVATGSFSAGELSACRPSLLLETLEEPDRILSEMEGWPDKEIDHVNGCGHAP